MRPCVQRTVQRHKKHSNYRVGAFARSTLDEENLFYPIFRLLIWIVKPLQRPGMLRFQPSLYGSPESHLDSLSSHLIPRVLGSHLVVSELLHRRASWVMAPGHPGFWTPNRSKTGGPPTGSKGFWTPQPCQPRMWNSSVDTLHGRPILQCIFI